MALALQLRHLFIFWCALVGALVFQIYGALLGFLIGYLAYFVALAVDGWTPEIVPPARRRRFYPGVVIGLIWLLATYNVVLAWLYLGGHQAAIRWVLTLAPFVEAFAPGVPAVARLGAQLAANGHAAAAPLLTHIYVVDWMAALGFAVLSVLRHETALLAYIAQRPATVPAAPIPVGQTGGRQTGGRQTRGRQAGAGRPDAAGQRRGGSSDSAAQRLFAAAFFSLLFVLTLNWAVLGVDIGFCTTCTLAAGDGAFGDALVGLRDWTLAEVLGVAHQPHRRAGHFLPVLASIFLNLLLLFMMWRAVARLVLRAAQRHGYVRSGG